MSDDAEKSYSIWGVLAVFLLLATLGILIMVMSGSDETSPTEALPIDTATMTTITMTTTTIVPMTFPDGSPVPERIEKVESAPGQTTYIYRLPAGFTDQPTNTAVAPAIVEAANGGAAVTIAMACAVSDGSVPAEVIVLEDPHEVRLVPVAIGHSLASPCPAGQTIESITFPLDQPLGTRRLVLAAAGSEVKLPGT